MTLLQSNVPGYSVRRGKVRDIYDVDEDKLIIVCSDRISAFDRILPNGVPDKGKILTQISLWWAKKLKLYYHNLAGMAFPAPFRGLEDRSMFVTKTKVIPIECVVRGYLCGSGWKDYKRTGEVCGIKLPKGLKENQQLPVPIFTPATKAEVGHDENISFDHMVKEIGLSRSEELKEASIEIYQEAAEYAWYQGIIIADTKFEWGLDTSLSKCGDVMLIDEVLTPDSSRFWALDEYQLGVSMPSFDKQGVRDWLENSGWDKESPPPELPLEVIEQTRLKYLEAYKRITGEILVEK